MHSLEISYLTWDQFEKEVYTAKTRKIGQKIDSFIHATTWVSHYWLFYIFLDT